MLVLAPPHSLCAARSRRHSATPRHAAPRQTFLIRLSRRLADIALVLSMTFFVLLAFLKASDNLSGDYIHHLLIMLGVGLVVLFGVMTTPLVFMYYRRP